MKKLIMALTAIVAASMIFVSCGDLFGGGKDKGTKWDKTFFVDATEEADTPLEKDYRRAWKQLSSTEDVAGIVTTITIKKDGLKSTTGTGVVGLMFDYNVSKDANGKKDNSKRDFGILGINMDKDRKGAAYYLCKYENLPFDEAAPDTDNAVLEMDADGNTIKNVCTDLTKNNENGVWYYGDFFTEVPDFEFKTESGVTKEKADAYQFVVKVWPSLDANDNPDGKGYDVYIGKDKDNLKKIKGTAYTSERTTNKKNIKINSVEYPTLRGGICMYANAKKGTNVVANYKTERPAGGQDNNFTDDEDFKGAQLIGNLQLVNPEY